MTPEKENLQPKVEKQQIGNNQIDDLFLQLQKNIKGLSDDAKDIIKKVFLEREKIGKTDSEIALDIKKIALFCRMNQISAENFMELGKMNSDVFSQLLKDDLGVLKTYLLENNNNIKTKNLEKINNNKEEIKSKSQEKTIIIEKWNEDLKVFETTKIERINVLKNINKQLLQSLQAQPLTLTPEQLATVTTNISDTAKQKMKADGITNPEATYQQYVYALQNPDSMSQGMREIIGNSNPQDLIEQCNTDYGITFITEKKVSTATYEKAEPDRKLDGNVVTIERKNDWEIGLNASFAVFETQFFDPANDIHKFLDQATEEHIGKQWMWDKNNNVQRWFEEVWIDGLKKQTMNFQNFSQNQLEYILTGVVSNDKIPSYSKAMMAVLEKIKKDPTLMLNKSDKNIQSVVKVLDTIIKRRFLQETQQNVKREIAQQYLGQVADTIKAGWSNILMDNDAKAVTYDENGTMNIWYHTQEGIKGVMTVDTQWQMTITDNMASQWSNGEKNSNLIQKTQRTLSGKLLPLSEMMRQVSTQKQLFVDAWNKHTSQSSYETWFYNQSLKEKAKNFVTPTEEQDRSKHVLHASLNHTLHTTRVFDSLVKFVAPYQTWEQSLAMDYFGGKNFFLDKTQHPEYLSLFAMRDMCAQASTQDMQNFEWTLQKLQATYTGVGKEQNPFYNALGKQQIRQFFDYFRTNDTTNGGFDTAACSKLVDQIALDKPKDIQTWITEKEERVAMIPMQSSYHKVFESLSAENTSTKYLTNNLDTAYPGRK